MLGAVALLAQLASTPSEPPMAWRAQRAVSAIELDGRLDDAAWAAAEPITAFRQRIPDRGAPGSERTELRVLHDDDMLYVGVRAHDREASAIVAPLTRRDQIDGTDRIGIFLDTWHDRRTAFAFFVTPAGVKRDEYLYNDNQGDVSWDATWSVATSRDGEGWTAEFAIPFAQLRFRATEPLRFGFNVVRSVSRRNEVMELSPLPQDLSQIVSRFGTLEGFTDVTPKRRVEVLPYFSARERFGSVPLPPGSRPFGGTAGADLRVGLGASLTLSAAINPDFGQLDGDPGSIELGPSELFFAERRPFFVEGSGAFQFGIAASPMGPEGLIYTRRIGRAPQLAGRAVSGAAPSETTILGAAKVTGRLGDRWNVAGLAAVTQAEFAPGLATDGSRVRRLVEPGAVYAAGSLGRDFRDGRTVLTGLATLVHRHLDDDTVALRRDALVLGGDLLHRWGDDDGYQVRTTLAASRIAGSEAAILAAQQSPVRYVQRPDNAAATLDPEATVLAGLSATTRVEKRAGDWRWSLAGLYRSPGFEANDLGFHFWSGRWSTEGGVTRRADRLGALRNAQARMGYFHVATLDGDRINAGLNLQLNATLPNAWTVHVGGWYRFGGHDVLALRGGPAVRLPANPYLTTTINTDPTRRVRATLVADWWQYTDGSQRGLYLLPQVTWRPVDRAELGVGLRWGGEVLDPQHLRTAASDGTVRYLVGRVDQRTTAITLRANYTVSPTLSLQLWGEPFIATGSYDRFRQLAAPRAGHDGERFRVVDASRGDGTVAVDLDGDGTRELELPDPDFTTASLRSNLVLRWEYRPSSAIFLVWQHDRAWQGDDGTMQPGRIVGDLLTAPARHQLALKVSYWWNAR